jgi:hypothetical protein
LLIVVELGVKKSTIGVEDRVRRVYFDELGKLLLALHIVTIVEKGGDVFEATFQLHIREVFYLSREVVIDMN